MQYYSENDELHYFCHGLGGLVASERQSGMLELCRNYAGAMLEFLDPPWKLYLMKMPTKFCYAKHKGLFFCYAGLLPGCFRHVSLARDNTTNYFQNKQDWHLNSTLRIYT